MNRPWSKFFWRDWQGDIRLRGCSLAARGLWMEMLAIMAQSDRYGYLASNGKPIAHDQLARLIGADNDTVKGLLNELIAAGVPSIDGDTLYSRRMVREMERHRAAVDSGKMGGNPRLLNQKSEAIFQKPEAREDHKAPLKGMPAAAPPGFDAFWSAYPKKVGIKAAIKAWNKAKDRPSIDEIVNAISLQSKYDQWTKDGGQFIPNPSTWLNQGRWADQPVSRPSPTGRRTVYD